MQLSLHQYPPMTPRAQTRVMVNRARLALQLDACRPAGIMAMDVFIALYTGALIGWVVGAAI